MIDSELYENDFNCLICYKFCYNDEALVLFCFFCFDNLFYQGIRTTSFVSTVMFLKVVRAALFVNEFT